MKKILIYASVLIFVSTMLLASGAFAGEEESAEMEAEIREKTEALYIVSIGWWGFEWAQQVKYGAQQAEKFWNEVCGHNIKVEFVGPMDADTDKIYEGIETAIAKNPTGMYVMDLGMGEEKIIQPYLDRGGIVTNIGAPPKTYTTHAMIGNDLFYFGQIQAKKAIELKGESFKYAIGSLPESPQHIRKREGIKDIMDQYPNIEYVGMADDGKDIPEGVQNYTAFLTIHPDIDVFITTSGIGGAAAYRALEESGYEPGEIVVVSADMTADHITGLDKGFITRILGTELANFGFYAISIMHLRHLNAAPLTKNDEATGHLPGPVNIVIGNPWIDKSNVEYWMELNFSD